MTYINSLKTFPSAHNIYKKVLTLHQHDRMGQYPQAEP